MFDCTLESPAEYVKKEVKFSSVLPGVYAELCLSFVHGGQLGGGVEVGGEGGTYCPLLPLCRKEAICPCMVPPKHCWRGFVPTCNHNSLQLCSGGGRQQLPGKRDDRATLAAGGPPPPARRPQGEASTPLPHQEGLMIWIGMAVNQDLNHIAGDGDESLHRVTSWVRWQIHLGHHLGSQIMCSIICTNRSARVRILQYFGMLQVNQPARDYLSRQINYYQKSGKDLEEVVRQQRDTIQRFTPPPPQLPGNEVIGSNIPTHRT